MPISHKQEKRQSVIGGLVAVDELDVEIKEKTIHSIIGAERAGKPLLQLCHRILSAGRRGDPAQFPFPCGSSADQNRASRHCQNLSEHPSLPCPHRHGKRSS